MICKKCHGHLEEDVSVCPVCGEAVEAEETPAQEAECQEMPQVIMEDVTIVPGEQAQWVSGIEIKEDVLEEAEAEPASEAEPEPAKKKTWVRVTAIVACVVLFFGLAASVWYGINGGFAPKANDEYYKDQYYVEEDKAIKSADTVIAIVGDAELTNGQFQVFYWMGVYDFLQQYSDYLSYLGLDLNQPMHAQYADENTTWEQYFIRAALNNWHSYQSLLLHAETEGFEISDLLAEQLDAVAYSLEESAIEYGFANADAMVQADMGPGADLADYANYLRIYYSSMEYFEGLYDEVNPTDAEIEAYFEANKDQLKSKYGVDKESGKLIDVRHILIMPEGGTKDELGQTTYSEEEWEACRIRAKAILSQWQMGEATEDSFAQLAMEVTEDPGSQNSGGLYTYVYEGKMVPEFNDWCFDENRQYGDTGLVKTSYGYHIMFFVYGEEGWSRYSREGSITDACTVIMEEAATAYPMVVNYKNIVLSKADMAY